jgi:hypothetical protein
MNDSFFSDFSFLGKSVIFAPEFFSKKSSANNTPINRYQAPGGFGKTSAPAAGATPTAR